VRWRASSVMFNVNVLPMYDAIMVSTIGLNVACGFGRCYHNSKGSMVIVGILMLRLKW